MYYTTDENKHGLKHDPFKALAVPRPIGWISTTSKEGKHNLAPYSFFNAISDRPPMVMFCSAGHKDSLRNIEETGEFTCSLSTWDLRDEMNVSSATVPYGVDEFALAGLEPAASGQVRPPRVARSPAAFECKHWKTIELPAPTGKGTPYIMVLGTVVAIYIDDAFVRDGLVDVPAMKPLARLGYMDYSVLTREAVFEMQRPIAQPDGSLKTPSGPWDGVYR